MLPEHSIKMMALARFVCSLVEMMGVYWLLKSETVKSALKVNAVLSVVGPLLLLLSWVLGLLGLARESIVSLKGLIALIAGIILIFAGANM